MGHEGLKPAVGGSTQPNTQDGKKVLQGKEG